MPIPTFTGLPPYPEFGDVTNKINKLVQELQNLMLSLDTLNIAELNANVIIANTITADKMDVSELSAITANLGHITAGLIESIQIFGSYIATANGTYPRCEMSAVGNLFGAYQDALHYVDIEPDGPASTPSLNFYNADSTTLPRGSNYLTEVLGNTYYTMFGAERIQLTGAQIWLNGPVLINSYANITDGVLTLQDQLDVLQNQINTLKGRFDSHGHSYNGTTSDGATYSGTTDGPNN